VGNDARKPPAAVQTAARIHHPPQPARPLPSSDIVLPPQADPLFVFIKTACSARRLN